MISTWLPGNTEHNMIRGKHLIHQMFYHWDVFFCQMFYFFNHLVDVLIFRTCELRFFSWCNTLTGEITTRKYPYPQFPTSSQGGLLNSRLLDSHSDHNAGESRRRWVRLLTWCMVQCVIKNLCSLCSVYSSVQMCLLSRQPFYVPRWSIEGVERVCWTERGSSLFRVNL